jgi:hypothetical protein
VTARGRARPRWCSVSVPLDIPVVHGVRLMASGAPRLLPPAFRRQMSSPAPRSLFGA